MPMRVCAEFINIKIHSLELQPWCPHHPVNVDEYLPSLLYIPSQLPPPSESAGDFFVYS